MMRCVVVMAVLALAGCAKGPPPAPAPAVQEEAPPDGPAPVDHDGPLWDRVNQAADLIEKGSPADLSRAVALLERAQAEDETGIASFDLGLAYQAQGSLDRARTQYEAVIADHPEIAAARLYLGQVLERQGDLAGAEQTYRDGIAADGEDMALRVALIAVQRAQGRPDDAIEAAKAALKVNANTIDVYNNFALAYLDKGDTTLARFILQKAQQSVDGAVQNAYLHTNLGWSYYLDGNRPAAAKSLKKAVELDERLVPALVYLSRVYLEDRNYEDMVPLLETAKEVAPSNPDVQLNLGVAYRGVGRLDDARKAYEQALVLNPEGAKAHFNLGILFGDYEKDYDASISAFERYVAAGGTEAERASEYIEDVQKEKERAERRARAEAARRAREEERARQQALLEEQAAAAEEPADEAAEQGSDEAGTEGSDSPEPAEEEAP